MSGIILTLPILDEKLKAWRRFRQEVSDSVRMMFEASLQRSGIPPQQLALVETDFDSTDAATMKVPVAAVPLLGQMIASVLAFDVYKN